jgi:RES domain.
MIDIRENIIYTDLEPKEKIGRWKYLLQNLTFERINSQFESYINTCLVYPTSFERIEACIDSLFNVDYKDNKFYPHFKTIITSEFGNKNHPYYLFRVRKINKGVYYDLSDLNAVIAETFDFEEIQTLDDIWERPAAQVINYQRLSKPNNSVLYTSLMTSTALLETNIREKQDLFFLIVYKSKRNIVYNDCCSFVYYNDLTENENMKRYIIFQFLRNEFTRVLPDTYNSENQYCSAESISRKFFISADVDGIQYPSTRGLGHRNFAFWSSSARSCLEFVGIRCCSMDKREGHQSLHKVFADCFWNKESMKFEYVSPFTDMSKRVFGDPILNIFMSK